MINRNLPPGIAPDQGSEEVSEPAINASADTVPLDCLGMPDEQEQMTPPEVGDEVNYQVTGKVTAINGGVATIQRTSINGKDIGDDESQEPANESEAARNEVSGLTSLG